MFDEVKDNFLVYGFLLIFTIFFVLVGLRLNMDAQLRERASKTPLAIETNSIGCTKYRYKEDTYWKCPKGSGISMIEESVVSGKMTKQVQVPVVEEN